MIEFEDTQGETLLLKADDVSSVRAGPDYFGNDGAGPVPTTEVHLHDGQRFHVRLPYEDVRARLGLAVAVIGLEVEIVVPSGRD